MREEERLKVLEEKAAELRRLAEQDGLDLHEEIAVLERKIAELRRQMYAELSPWARVQLARRPDRPSGLPFVQALCEAFYELRGDRVVADDPALRGGLARLAGRRLAVLFHHRGATPEEQRVSRFGMASAQGYWKAKRIMEVAARLRLAVLTLINTPGAYPGVQAEAHNVAGAIASCIWTMLRHPAPTVAVILGEGGSGGAVAIAAADRVLMLENATYSVISPEGAASILWKDAKVAPKAAEALKLTARDLYELGLIDEVIPEPPGGAHTDFSATVAAVRQALLRHPHGPQKLLGANLLLLQAGVEPGEG
ncbi:MAG: carboxyl transferase domain-containing protein, partial [Candidatus Bipolaricaulaceae bacterium]